uniref:Uncharacterized protein n=1 Tax=Trypanosoma congolense (strain IL3000) TaxID=1068625 RepID=G0UU03_TRYCI|nr:hypothetical protein, unlikely [Trypanosoma congolense IL3000]
MLRTPVDVVCVFRHVSCICTVAYGLCAHPHAYVDLLWARCTPYGKVFDVKKICITCPLLPPCGRGLRNGGGNQRFISLFASPCFFLFGVILDLLFFPASINISLFFFFHFILFFQ